MLQSHFISITYAETDRFYCSLRLSEQSLVRSLLDENNIPWKMKMVSSCFKEYSDARAATTRFLAIGAEILVFWQSCFGSHVNDKMKELSARFRASKFKWTGTTFESRKEAKVIYLLLDGEWRQADLEMFVKSGVDEIFYSDNVDQLINKVRKILNK